MRRNFARNYSRDPSTVLPHPTPPADPLTSSCPSGMTTQRRGWCRERTAHDVPGGGHNVTFEEKPGDKLGMKNGRKKQKKHSYIHYDNGQARIFRQGDQGFKQDFAFGSVGYHDHQGASSLPLPYPKSY